MDYLIRELETSEYWVLEDFLYEAIFVLEGVEVPSRDILELPEIRLYIEDFGKKDDLCLVAEMDGKIVGAVWTRIMRDYGYVDDFTPSLSISLYKEYRGMGIGRKLMEEMFDLLKDKGYHQVSLSVQKENYAADLYKSLGFRVVKENEEDFIMVYSLKR